MKLFQRYVLRSFLKYILIVGLFVTLMSLISSIMGESKDLAAYNYSLSDFLLLQLYALALTLNLTMPAITTIAAIVVIIMLMRSNELLAFVTLGGTVKNLAVPLITIGAFIAAGMIIWEYAVIPNVRIEREELRSNMKGRQYSKSATYTNIWMMDGDKKLVNINFIDMLGGVINGITEYTINDNYEITAIEKIDSAIKKENAWEISGRHITNIIENPPTITVSNQKETIRNKLWDDLMTVAVVEVRALSPSQLQTLSQIMKEHGMSTSQYDMLLYSKFANAISVIVLLILTFPIAINFSRNYSIIKNAALTLVLGLIFWAFQASCFSLGKTGVLSPFNANFLPIFVFIGISAIIIYIREYRR